MDPNAAPATVGGPAICGPLLLNCKGGFAEGRSSISGPNWPALLLPTTPPFIAISSPDTIDDLVGIFGFRHRHSNLMGLEFGATEALILQFSVYSHPS